MTFERGKRYRATIVLSGISKMLGTPARVQQRLLSEYGLNASVKQLARGKFQAEGTWTRKTENVQLPDNITAAEV